MGRSDAAVDTTLLISSAIGAHFDPNRPGGVTVGTLIGAAEKAGADPALWRAGATTTVVALSGHPTPMTAIPARMTPAEALALMNETVVFAHSWGGETLLAHILADGKVEAIHEPQLKRSLANRQVIVQTKDKTVFVNLSPPCGSRMRGGARWTR